jgi:signal transduction histidine kinase
MFVVAPISLGSTVIGFLILGSPVDPGGQLHRLLLTMVLGGLGTLVIALAGGYWLADRALRPVKAITRTAREISNPSRGVSPLEPRTIRIGGHVRSMLARLQAAFNRQRQFPADASHELRTPLTV